MNLNWHWLKTPTGHLVLAGGVLVAAGIGFRLRLRNATAAALPSAKASLPAIMPQVFRREGATFPKTTVAPEPVASNSAPSRTSAPIAKPPAPRPVLPLTLDCQMPAAPSPAALVRAPYGRLIPCETIVALESNRLDTPVIGLVTEDVWHDGKRVIPAGAEVHGRAALDRTRERLAVQGAWHIVWRTTDAENGTDLGVEGLALDRGFDSGTGSWDDHDGSAGLRGTTVKTQDDRELKLFAATFLSAATTALQETRPTAGLLGEGAVPVASGRSAALAGTAAILRDYAQQMRDAIQRDGFYLRVPAGKQFYLYVTQPIERPVRFAAATRQP
jgi:hypothetical protein